jgi:hypothetical protein
MIPLPFAVPWRLVGTLLACVGLLGAGAWAEHWRAGRAAAIEQAAELAQKLEAQQEAQRITARLGAKSQGVQDAYATQARKERAAADHARDAAGRLYDDLAAAQRAADDADSACPTDAEATALRQLFGTCSGRYRDVAAEAGSYAGQLAALQQWTGSICAPAVAPEGTRGDR